MSPTTIQGYRKILRNHFPDIMDISVKRLTRDMIIESLNKEYKRPSKRYSDGRPLKAKTISNAFGLLKTVLSEVAPRLDTDVKLAQSDNSYAAKKLLSVDTIFQIIKGSPIELPVLLAMWLSFTVSEIRGLTKSGSLKDGYLLVKDSVVDVNGKPQKKSIPKNKTRIRKHKIPNYIQHLIDQTDPAIDALVPFSGQALYKRWSRLLEKHNLPHMTFHDLRHLNASVMAFLSIPDKYAQERGGWKTDVVMKRVYQHTFDEGRIAVDDKINQFFENKMQHEMQHIK